MRAEIAARQARYAGYSDPDLNPGFGRRWTDPPDLKTRGRRPEASRTALENFTNNSTIKNKADEASPQAVWVSRPR